MKKLFFILTTLLFLHPHRALSASPCDAIDYAPKLVFSTSYGRLVYDDSKGLDDLTRLGSQFGTVEQGLFAAGLATVKVGWEIEVTSMVSKQDNIICVLPATIEVFIGYENPVIYLSRELQPGTCEYNVVVRHEQTHQQINKTALEYYIPELKYRISAMTRDIRPIQVKRLTDTKQATAQLTQQYIERIHPLVEAFKQVLQKEQGKLDNHTNYKLEGDLCKYYHAKQKAGKS